MLEDTPVPATLLRRLAAVAQRISITAATIGDVMTSSTPPLPSATARQPPR